MTLFELSLFGISIRPTWYGLMYALGFFICYKFVKWTKNIDNKDMENLLFFVFLGVIVGGRIGYVLLYNLPYFLDHPMKIFATWEGGMSFHGGAIGVILSLFLFAWKYKYPIFQVSDVVVTILPIALGLGRIGNYINGELPGFFPYTGPFAMIQNGVGHFPSPLLQALLEGPILFSILLGTFFWQRKNINISGLQSGIFLIGYGIFRVISESFRLPDIQVGYLFGTNWITLGMIYSLPMILGGIFILMLLQRNDYTISGRTFPGRK